MGPRKLCAYSHSRVQQISGQPDRACVNELDQARQFRVLASCAGAAGVQKLAYRVEQRFQIGEFSKVPDSFLSERPRNLFAANHVHGHRRLWDRYLFVHLARKLFQD